MEALKFIVDTLLWLLCLAFVLRLLFQWVRADFRDPMADAIVRVTNWLILPLRRILPPIAKIDTATVVAVLFIAALHTTVMLALGGFGYADPLLIARSTGIDLIDMVLRIYLFALLLYGLTSFVSPGGYAPGLRLLGQLLRTRLATDPSRDTADRPDRFLDSLALDRTRGGLDPAALNGRARANPGKTSVARASREKFFFGVCAKHRLFSMLFSAPS